MIRAITPLLAAAALACACSPDSPAPGGSQAPAAVAAEASRPAAEVAAQPAAAEAPPPAAAAVAQAAAPAPRPGPLRRCGWLHNPTPGNWWLFDGQGEHIIATQGGYQAPGMDEMPDMTTKGWVKVNGSYGYGCACMRVTLDPETLRVTQISGAAPQPLKQCRDDPRLPRP
jgi:hypothetical protein